MPVVRDQGLPFLLLLVVHRAGGGVAPVLVESCCFRVGEVVEDGGLLGRVVHPHEGGATLDLDDVRLGDPLPVLREQVADGRVVGFVVPRFVVEDGEAPRSQLGGRRLPDRGEAFLVAGALGGVGELIR